MFNSDEHIKAHALLMWANYIETGNVIMSRLDAVNSGRHNSIKALNQSQQEFVIKLRRLSTEELSKDSINSKALSHDPVSAPTAMAKRNPFRLD